MSEENTVQEAADAFEADIEESDFNEGEPVGEYEDDTQNAYDEPWTQEAEDVDNYVRQERQRSEDTHAQAAGSLQAEANKLVSDAAAFDRDVAAVDWDALKQRNPAEFAALKQEFAQRRADIERRAQAVREQHGAQSAQEQQKAARELERQVTSERNKLLAKLPSWQDDGVRSRETRELRQYLNGLGFTDSEVASAMDHRLILMARKAMLHDKGKSSNVIRLGKKKGQSREAKIAREIKSRNVSEDSLDAAAIHFEHLLNL